DDPEQHVEHALGIGLHEPGVTGEHPLHDLARLLGRELEEHVIGVGDLDEEVRAPGWLCLSACGSGCTRTPVASVAMQCALASSSLRIAWTIVAPTAPPASSSQRHIVPR